VHSDDQCAAGRFAPRRHGPDRPAGCDGGPVERQRRGSGKRLRSTGEPAPASATWDDGPSTVTPVSGAVPG